MPKGKIEKGFVSFFLFVFGMSQLLIIFSLVLSISQAVGSNRSGWERMVQSFSMLLVTASLGLNIYGFGCILDDVHKTFKAIRNCLQDKMRQIPDEMERGEIINIVMNIDKAGPLNGNVFF